MKKTVSFSRHATNVFFHLLTSCNLQCRHCYINPAQHGRQTLPLATIERWLTLFAGQAKAANVIFLGGEPTLHPDLAAAVQAARRIGYQSVTVDTNGYLFYDILDRVAPDQVDYFSFSLDGPDPETNDAIRGKGCFEACTAGIRRAVKKGFNTSLIYTVSRENIEHLPKMPPLLTDLGVERFFIQVIGIRGKSARAEPGSLQLTHDEWIDAVFPVAKKAVDQGIVVSYPKVFLDAGEVFECAGQTAHNYFIFPNGRVYRCPLCEDYPLHSLRIQNDRLMPTPKINEQDLFRLTIPEGCVMNKLVQPDNLAYDSSGRPLYRVACCMLKEEISKA